jgi:hypothetical protein
VLALLRSLDERIAHEQDTPPPTFERRQLIAAERRPTLSGNSR